jgi:glycine/D-amino acid oxidase-like deaminating enzyme
VSAAIDARILRALTQAEPGSFWLADPARPEAAPQLAAHTTADLVVIGGGYSGLWTALLAKEADPTRDVVLLEGHEIGWAASGRNGGFCAASLTHGLGNGMARWPKEMPELLRLGRENLDGIEATLQRYGLDAEFERTGSIDVATAPWQAEDLRAHAAEVRELGEDVEWLEADGVRALVDSPTYVGGLLDRSGTALVHPAKLAWALREACLRLGVRLHERSEVTSLDAQGSGVIARTPYGSVRASRAALATNVFPSLLRRVRPYVVPVWDYVLVTEPLSPEQRTSIGWAGREGVGDAGNQFHYYRLTADDRILWGGFDAVYHYGNGMDARHEHDAVVYGRLAEHFFETFPSLEGLRFAWRWGGAIDTCTRFCAFWGTAHGGRTAYVAVYTGLGVGATRFGARVLLDLLDGRESEVTGLEMVQKKPIPFPPEPLRSVGINLTRKSLARADAKDGRRNLWLRALDRAGLGFDS